MGTTPRQMALLIWVYSALWAVNLGHIEAAIGNVWSINQSLWLGSLLWSTPLAILGGLLSEGFQPDLPRPLYHWLLGNAVVLALLV